MDAEFWHARWASNQIGFHQAEGNRALTAHFSALGLSEGARIFVPLCGKSRDIAWLLGRDCRVAGAELSPIAITQLFEELGATPTIAAADPGAGALEHRHAPGLDVFIGDVFALNAAQLGPVDAVYDRAALIALPEGMRRRYADHVQAIAGGAPQLLVCLDYAPGLLEGPPFSLEASELIALYGGAYDITSLSREQAPEGVRGVKPVYETAWWLSPKG